MPKMNPSETRKLMTSFKTFVTEGNGQEQWSKSEANLLEDLKITLGNLLPRVTGKSHADDNYAEFVQMERLSSKDPYEYEILLKDGTKIKATKEGRWSGHWSFNVDGEEFKYDMRTGYNTLYKLGKKFEQKYMTLLQQFEKRLKNADWHYQYADDNSSYRSGEASVQAVYDALKKLPNSQWQDAFILWKKHAPDNMRGYSISQFKKLIKEK